jgi:D-alanine-D-alanine ligase
MKKIAILTGGISTERAVALRSGENMKNWCENAGYAVDVYDIPDQIDDFLWRYMGYELIIPVLHGRYGEDGIISGMCETLGLRVAGCPSHIHALCIDKFHTNCVVEKLWIKVPKSWMPWLPKPIKLLPADWARELEKTLIVKPNQWWSSLATTKAKTPEELKNGIQAVNDVISSLTSERIQLLSNWKEKWRRYFPPLTDTPLVQECIEWREFTVWVYYDESGYHVLPIIEICTLSGDFFNYNEKYETDGSNEVFSELETPLRESLENQSIRICQFLGTKWVVRLDWRYDGCDLYFLEVNTIPGFTSGSLIPKMWKKAEKSESDFINILNL